MTYNRCRCKTGDHDLDGKPDRCLNDAGKRRRLCDNCRKPFGWSASSRGNGYDHAIAWTEAENRAQWGDR